MAGSYLHCCKWPEGLEDVWTDAETLTVLAHGVFDFSSIENLGDAHEACEEMFAMIQHLTGGDAGRIKAAMDST